MNILVLTFKNSPREARQTISEINKKDNEISLILDKLSENGPK